MVVWRDRDPLDKVFHRGRRDSIRVASWQDLCLAKTGIEIACGGFRMTEDAMETDNEPADGDWDLVDLSEDVVFEATRMAHALGMEFHAFMINALEEKMARHKDEPGLEARIARMKWYPPLGPQYPGPGAG
jgi:hypothetical protein